MRQNYRKIVSLFVLAVLTGLSLSAMPVFMKRQTVTQPNGVTVTILTEGDEFYHITTTTDGAAVEKCMDGYVRYLAFDGNRRITTPYAVGDKNVPASVISSARSIPYFQMQEEGRKMRARDYEYATVRAMKAQAAAQARPAAEKRNIKGAVILVEFKDVKFTLGNKDKFERMLNEDGYSDNGATGSAVNYFKDQFGDLADFHFDVYGPYTARNNMEYYGGNGYGGSDQAADELVAEACQALDSEIDFSQYDMDNDGECDFVFMFFAGFDEARGGGADCIWSHKYALYNHPLTLDGKKIFTYACTSELMGNNQSNAQFAAIGTFCHEFSHVLGLADAYDTSYNNDGYKTAEALWQETSIMDGGGYNDNSNTPPHYNAFEREMAGILEPIEAKDGKYTLEPIHKTNRVIRIESDVKDEYFMIECRKRDAWDAPLSNDGLLIYHIDKSTNDAGKSYYYNRNVTAKMRWTYNEVNSYPMHQCADLVEAPNKTSGIATGAIYFPGTRNVTECSSLTHDAFKCWSGKAVDFSIKDIKIEGDNVSFTLSSGASEGLPTVTSHEAKVVGNDVVLSWTPDQNLENQTSKVTLLKGFTEVKVIEDIKNNALILEDLEPSSEYTAKIECGVDGVYGETYEAKFTTTDKTYTFPYIALNRSQLVKGSAVSLNVLNVQADSYEVKWFINGSEITIPENALMSFDGEGEIKAVITYPDGKTEAVSMKVTLK